MECHVAAATPHVTQWSSVPPLRVAHLLAGLGLHLGGPPKSVPQLAQAQAALGHEVVLFVLDDRRDGPYAPTGDLNVEYFRAVGAKAAQLSPRLIRRVGAFRPHIIHSHGLWTLLSLSAHAAANFSHAHHVCSPHGMLDAHALTYSRRKKHASRLLFQDRVLRRAAALQALTPGELVSIREFGLSNPVALIPNGVTPCDDQPACQSHTPGSLLHGRKIVLFAARLNPKKNIISLIRAWESLRLDPDHTLVIAGSGDREYEAYLRATVQASPAADSIVFVGLKTPVELDILYREAALFVLPSLSEGFSVAVLEALEHGVPVCITRACQFDDVEAHGAGFICDADPSSIAAALRQAIDLTPAQRKTAGEAGQRLVRSRFAWPVIARQMTDVYEWLAGHWEQLPEIVHVA